jgi:hypothetical protein
MAITTVAGVVFSNPSTQTVNPYNTATSLTDLSPSTQQLNSPPNGVILGGRLAVANALAASDTIIANPA